MCSNRLCVYIANKGREVYTGSDIVAVTKDEILCEMFQLVRFQATFCFLFAGPWLTFGSTRQIAPESCGALPKDKVYSAPSPGSVKGMVMGQKKKDTKIMLCEILQLVRFQGTF